MITFTYFRIKKLLHQRIYFPFDLFRSSVRQFSIRYLFELFERCIFQIEWKANEAWKRLTNKLLRFSFYDKVIIGIAVVFRPFINEWNGSFSCIVRRSSTGFTWISFWISLKLMTTCHREWTNTVRHLFSIIISMLKS